MRPVRLSLTILLAATASCSLPQQPRSSQSHTQGSSGGGGGSSGSSSKEPNTDIEAEIRNALTVAGWAGLGTFLLGLPGVLIRGSRTSSRGGAQHSLAQKPNLVDSLALQSQQSQSPPPGPPPFDVSPLRSLSTSQLRRKLERLRQKTEASGKESGIRACRKQMDRNTPELNRLSQKEILLKQIEWEVRCQLQQGLKTDIAIPAPDPADASDDARAAPPPAEGGAQQPPDPSSPSPPPHSSTTDPFAAHAHAHASANSVLHHVPTWQAYAGAAAALPVVGGALRAARDLLGGIGRWRVGAGRGLYEGSW